MSASRYFGFSIANFATRSCTSPRVILPDPFAIVVSFVSTLNGARSLQSNARTKSAGPDSFDFPAAFRKVTASDATPNGGRSPFDGAMALTHSDDAGGRA